MKKNLTLLLLLCIVSLASAQKKDKIKGSRAVTLEVKEVSAFENIEVSDNLEIFLIKGNVHGIEIEADDNLHDAISYTVSAGNLILGASQDVTSSKKFSVRVTYTSDLNLIVAKNDAIVTALNDMDLVNLTVKTFDAARFFATVKSDEFAMMGNDKTKTELNVTARKVNIELSKNANLKGLISSVAMTFDMYQKSTAIIEGDVVDLKLRLDNNANFTGKNLAATSAELILEGYSECSLTANTNVIIEASGKSEIQLTGEPKIEIRKFTDNAVLAKKPVR